jgi:hypothetical protein
VDRRKPDAHFYFFFFPFVLFFYFVYFFESQTKELVPDDAREPDVDDPAHLDAGARKR